MNMLALRSTRGARGFIIAFALAALGAQAAIQTQTKSTAGTVTPSGNWANASNAASINGACALGDGSTTGAIMLTNFGFTVAPLSATILGITVRSVASFNDVSTQDQIRLVKAGSATGNAKVLNGPGSVSVPSCGAPIGGASGLTVGSSSDLWGATLIPNDVNSSGFGVFYDNDFFNTAVDGVEITVTYQDNIYYMVYTNVSGGGTISPSAPAPVLSGTTTTFTVTPNPGYSVTMGGSCGGSLVGTTYTTHVIVSECIVSATFTPTPDVAQDLNGDGRSDILYRNASTGQVYRLLMDGFSIAAEGIVYNEPNTAWKIVADGDFNGDGTADLLYRNDVTGQVFMVFLDASGAQSGGGLVYTEPNLNWKIIQAPDIDGDGRADILWWNSATGQVYAMLMNGLTIGPSAMIYTEPNTAWRIVAVGDFSGSGKRNQLVWRNTGTGQAFMLTVNYSGSFSLAGAMFYSEPNLAWKIVGAADFNGDHKSDLLWRNDSTGEVFMQLMNGPTVLGGGVFYTEANLAWKIVALGDYNGGGRADILWRNDSTGMVYMMQMNALSSTAQGIVYTEPNTAWKVLGPTEYAQ